MKKSVYLDEWLAQKPYDTQVATDGYYLNVCKEVKKILMKNRNLMFLEDVLSLQEIVQLSCFLTSYFEDLISETNIWNSFLKAHNRLYNKKLPFYNLDGYFDGEVNEADIAFLMWYFLNSIQDEEIISPDDLFIYKAAKPIAKLFDDLWEYAPENKSLKSYYIIDEDEKDFYIARKFIDRILFETYLFRPDTGFGLIHKLRDVLDNSNDDENILMYFNEIRDIYLHQVYTNLLSFKGKEWAAEILPENHKLKNDFLEMSNKVFGFFIYKGEKDGCIMLEHIASGKIFDVVNESIDNLDLSLKVGSVIYFGIVRWQGNWWFSGILNQGRSDKKIIEEERNNISARERVNFLNDSNMIDEVLQNQLKVFKEYNNGSQIAFLKSTEIQNFFEGFIDENNNSLNLSKKELKEAKARSKKLNNSNNEKESINFSKYSNSGLVFFNPKGGIEFVLGLNSAFPMTSNPFYNEKESNEHFTELLMSNSYSKELIDFCIENCKSKLPFFKDERGKTIFEDLDFLLRFWKKQNYFTKPAISFV